MSETNGHATKAAFKNAASGKRRFREETLPLVGKVLVRSLTGLEWAEIQSSAIRAGQVLDDAAKHRRRLANMQSDLMIACLCDPQEAPLFDTSDREWLAQLDAAVVQAAVTACQNHNGIADSDLEDFAKNLPTASGGSSPTSSQKTSADST